MRGSIFIALFISICILTLLYAGLIIATYEKPIVEQEIKPEDNWMSPQMLHRRYVHTTQPYQKDTTIIFTEEDSILSTY